MNEQQPDVPHLAELAELADSVGGSDIASGDVIMAEALPLPTVPPRPSNKLGVTGLVLALVSLLLLGFLAPIAVIVSLYAMRKPPKEMALAGFIIGAFATSTFLWSLIFGIAFFTSAASMTNNTSSWFTASQTRVTLQTDAFQIGQIWKSSKQLPTQAEGDKIVATTVDGWNNPVYYEIEGESFRLRSYGADKSPDTLDDVIVGPFYSGSEVTDF